jgi:hypothetical protein
MDVFYLALPRSQAAVIVRCAAWIVPVPWECCGRSVAGLGGPALLALSSSTPFRTLALLDSRHGQAGREEKAPVGFRGCRGMLGFSPDGARLLTLPYTL